MKKFLLTLSIVIFSLLVFGQMQGKNCYCGVGGIFIKSGMVKKDTIPKYKVKNEKSNLVFYGDEYSDGSAEKMRIYPNGTIVKDTVPIARLNIKDGNDGSNHTPIKFTSGTYPVLVDSGIVITDDLIDTGNYVIDLSDWLPSLDMWDSLAILNKFSEFQIIDSIEGSIFHYYVSEHDTSLFVRDSLATIKWLINSVIENNNQINKAYEVLKYINTEGEIIDKKRFKQAVKKFNNE